MEVLIALNKLFEKNITVNEASLKQELELLSYDEMAWNKFKQDVLDLTEGIAPPEFRTQGWLQLYQRLIWKSHRLKCW